jgi:hypothetical protein
MNMNMNMNINKTKERLPTQVRIVILILTLSVSAHPAFASPEATSAATCRWVDIDGDGSAECRRMVEDNDRDGIFDYQYPSYTSKFRKKKDMSCNESAIIRASFEFEEVWNSEDYLNNVWHMAVYDFDGDGKMGILSMAFTPTKQMYLFENDADNSYALVWVSPDTLAPPGAFVTVTGGDTDHDGYGEIIGGETSTLNQVLLYEATGDDSYAFRDIDVSEPDYTGNLSMDRVLVGDTDRDGIGEIIFDTGSATGSKVFIYEQTGPVGQNTYTKVYEYETVSYLVDLAIGDSDNDGNEEIVLGVGGWTGYPMYLRRLEYNPDLGTYEHKMMEPGVTSLPLSPTVGDIDGDGLNELVMGSAITGGGMLYILEAIADDQYTSIYQSPTLFNGNVLTTSVGLLMSEPYPGIIAGSFGGELRLYGFDGQKYQSLLDQPITSGGSIRGSYLGAIDGDEKTDIVFSSKGDDRVYVYEQLPLVRVKLLPDATTVERGGTLGYLVTVTNSSDEDKTFEYWSAVYLWNGEPYNKNPVFGPKEVTIKAGKTKSGHVSHRVPNNAPLRTYTLCGRIGFHPDDVWDEDCFEFTVVDGILLSEPIAMLRVLENEAFP